MFNDKNEERKSFREFVAENKGKIIAGATVVTIGTISYVLYRNTKVIKNLVKIAEQELEMTSLQGDFNHLVTEGTRDMVDQINIAKDIAKEGALAEAIEAVKRKIQYRVGKIEGCTKHNTPEALLQKEIYEKEIAILKDKLTIFQKEWENMLH